MMGSLELFETLRSNPLHTLWRSNPLHTLTGPNTSKCFVPVILQVESKKNDFCYRCIVEDAKLFKSLCRDSAMQPIAVVNVSYHAIVNVEEYLAKK